MSELYGVEAIVDALYDKKVDAILINEGSRDLVTDYKKNFDKDTRVIWTTKFKSYNKIKEEKTLDVLKNPSVYIFLVLILVEVYRKYHVVMSIS